MKPIKDIEGNITGWERDLWWDLYWLEQRMHPSGNRSTYGSDNPLSNIGNDDIGPWADGSGGHSIMVYSVLMKAMANTMVVDFMVVATVQAMEGAVGMTKASIIRG